jgi:hypothetical protein
MRHKQFVVTTTVLMFCLVLVVAGLAFYSNFNAAASSPNVPQVVRYLPAGSQGVFGMNVQKFMTSPLYKKFEAKQGARVGTDLQEFIAKTGVDPRKDIHYIVAAGGPGEAKNGKGIVIIVAVNHFNSAQIRSFINSKGTPIEVPYDKATVLMMPEPNGNKIEKGLAFLSDEEIAMGDLDSIKGVLDVKAGRTTGLDSTALGHLVGTVNPEEMFWFAGDPSSVIAKAPGSTPMLGNLSEIESIFGTLNLTDAVDGKITAKAKSDASAKKLGEVITGFKALGSLALSNTNQTPELTALFNDLFNGISITVEGSKVQLGVHFPYEVLDKMETMKTMIPKKTGL